MALKTKTPDATKKSPPPTTRLLPERPAEKPHAVAPPAGGKEATLTVLPATQRGNGALSTAADNALFADLGGTGFDEGLDAGAYALPFLTILQGLSPAVQRGTPDYIEGAMPGMILNTVTKELFEELRVSVVRRTHTLCRWTPRDAGGGFLGETPVDVLNIAEFQQLTPDEKGRRIDADKNEVTEHRNFYVALIHDDGRPQEPALISMTKSQLKHARTWNTNIGLKSAKGSNGLPVSISEVWVLGTQIQKNKKGDQWYGWAIRHGGRHTDPGVVEAVKEQVTFAKAQNNLVRQLEQIVDPEEATPGEM